MKFTVDQDIPFSAADTAQALADPGLYATYTGLDKVAVPDLVGHDIDGDQVTLRMRYRFAGTLNGAARALIDPAQLTWVDVAVHDLATHTTEFRLEPDHYRKQFRAHGRYRIEDLGDRCRRRADIEVVVAVPGVGRVVERAIASGLEEHLRDERSALVAYLSNAPERPVT